MPFGSLIPHLSGESSGEGVHVVIARFVSGQRKKSDKCDCHRCGENGCGPPHLRPPYPPAAIRFDSPLGLEKFSPPGSGGENCGNQRECDGNRDKYAHRARDADGLEKRQPGKTEAEKRPGDRRAGGQDNLGGSVVCGVEGCFPILAGLTCFLVPAEEKYSVVCTRGDPDGYQEIAGVGGQADKTLIAPGR